MCYVLWKIFLSLELEFITARVSADGQDKPSQCTVQLNPYAAGG